MGISVDDLDAHNRRMTELLGRLALREGSHPAAVEGVHVMRVSQFIARHPVL